MLLLRRALVVPLVAAGLAAVGCMSVPQGVHIYVSDSGCTSDGYCPWPDGAPHDFYYAPTRELVVSGGQSVKVDAHELCHAHQHETILEETGREPVGLTLTEGLLTDEAAAYRVVAEANPRPASWTLSKDNLIEDFAEACGRYLTGWRDQDPARDAFFAARGFR